MSPRAWLNALRDAVRSMTQSSLMSLASVATVAVSLLVLSVVLLLTMNVEKMAESVEKQVIVKGFLCSVSDTGAPCYAKELTPEGRQALIDQIEALPGVVKVEFTSREDALKQLKEDFGEQQDLLAGLEEGDNPLRDELRVEADDVKSVPAIGEAVRVMSGVGNVNYGQDWVKTLITLTASIRLGGAGLVTLLIIATVLTISNTIRLAVYARRREISIMKLVGATDWYIRRPFMMEGIFLGVFGALIAMALSGWGYNRVVVYLDQNIGFVPLVRPDQILMNQTLVLMALGGLLGAIGSLILMRKFLKV
jgi:cell division transport system permease protein